MQNKQISTILSKIDSRYEEWAHKNHVPGYAYGIVYDGELIHAKGGGIANIITEAPATPQSLFRIASMTKNFTALAILKLRDEKKLRLDDPIQMYIPEIGNQVITVRDLLIHTAGFPTDDPWADRKLHHTESDVKELLQKGISFSTIPGTAYEYSNLGYTLLGMIIQKVSKLPFEIYINENICNPIGMDNVFWDYSHIPQAQLAKGYRWTESGWEEEGLLKHGIFGAMGGMITSIESFSRFMLKHLSPCAMYKETQQPWRFRDLTTENNRILTSAYGYGLVWMRDSKKNLFIGHSGGLPGFGSNWFIMPEYGLGVVLFGNVTYAPATNMNIDVLYEIVDMIQHKPRIHGISEIIKQRKEELVHTLPHWENNHHIFAHNFFLDHPLAELKKESNQLFAKAGKILVISEVVPENNLRGHFTMTGENNTLQVKFSLSPENPPLIQAVHIKEITLNSSEYS